MQPRERTEDFEKKQEKDDLKIWRKGRRSRDSIRTTIKHKSIQRKSNTKHSNNNIKNG